MATERFAEHAATKVAWKLAPEAVEWGDINFTRLAELVCAEFDVDHIGGPLDDETHWIWDVAAEVGGRYRAEVIQREPGAFDR